MELAQAFLSEKQTYETEYELERGKPMPSKNHSALENRFSLAFGRYEQQYQTFIELSLDVKNKKATPDV